MKRKTYKTWTCASALVWFVFAILAWYAKYDLGTIATIGGIALMFAWLYEQENLSD